MGTLGMQETIFIFLLALIIFGPKKLPELGKNIAKGIAEFRRHSNDLKATFDKEMATIERETAEVNQDLTKYTNEINYDSSYDSNYYDSGYDGNNGTGETSPETSTVSASATQGAESSTATDNGSDGATITATAEDGVTTEYAAVGDSQSSAATETVALPAEPEPAPVART